MKRFYITAIPLSKNFSLNREDAERPCPLMYADPACDLRSLLPINAVIRSTMQPGDEAVVLAVRQDDGVPDQNYQAFRDELDSLRLPSYTVVDISAPENQHPATHMEMLRRITSVMTGSACYYACMTFGTKAYPMVLFAALNYAHKLLPDADVVGVYYREIVREAGRIQSSRMYNMNHLFSLTQLVDAVSALNCDDKTGLMQGLMGAAEADHAKK